MMSGLEGFLRAEIAQAGPMHMGDYMAYALGHPEYGYYMKQDPFGAEGDFTTAPEISQIFGEMLGAWVVDVWEKMGRPEAFTLLECGPGRGTLMADMLRVGAMVPGFLAACRVSLLEISPHLRYMQQAALADCGARCEWISVLGDVDRNKPVIVIGNEFLDALPVRQFEKAADGWQERVVGLEGQDLAMTLQAAPEALVPQGLTGVKAGDVVEVSEARIAFMREVLELLNGTGGAGLFVDYGHDMPAVGDTLQAVRGHAYCRVLECPGDADLSAHVDFSVLMELTEDGALAYQGQFLQALGAHVRAEQLMANEAQRDAVEAGYQRLVAADQMGRLFKVFGFKRGYDFDLAGF